MERNCFLTTIDNPYDYFDDFENWYNFDVDHGYNTCSYVARIAPYSAELSEEDNRALLKSSLDEIMRLNITGKYRIVYEKTPNDGEEGI